MLVKLNDLLSILKEIEEESYQRRSGVSFNLNSSTIQNLLGVVFPLQQFLSLVLSVWLKDTDEEKKRKIEQMLIYKIHRNNLEKDEQLDFDSIKILAPSERLMLDKISLTSQETKKRPNTSFYNKF